MKSNITRIKRRNFLRRTFSLSSGLMLTPLVNFSRSKTINSDSIYLIGPQEGYSPRVGTLLSTMTMMRAWVIETVKNLSQEQLDFQIDEKSNSIGAMLVHLAATEKYYQLHTFDEMKWGSWSKKIKNEWDVASALGPEGRRIIKGNSIDFYLSTLEEVREITKTEFAKRDDEWLDKSEIFFDNKPTNNHAKWFHVCEHESNHRGQMKFIIKRMP